MKKQLFFALLGLASLTESKSQNIAAARAAGPGASVTVRGIVTNGSELGKIRYMQDNSAGLAVYYGTVTPSFSVVAIGDSITVNGILHNYKNLLELDSIVSFSVLANNRPLPTPTVITPSGLSESLEGQLVKINAATFGTTGVFTGSTSGYNYVATANSQTFTVRILPNTNLVGTPIPTTAVNITAIESQYCSSPTVGCNTGYQVLPRSINDVVAVVTTGIREVSENSSIKVYPNPSNDKFRFEIAYGERVKDVFITDALGKIVRFSFDNENTVNVSALSDGVYQLNVITDKSRYQAKINVIH